MVVGIGLSPMGSSPSSRIVSGPAAARHLGVGLGHHLDHHQAGDGHLQPEGRQEERLGGPARLRLGQPKRRIGHHRRPHRHRLRTPGYPIADSIAAVLIALFIFRVGLTVFRDGVDKMVDRACDTAMVEEIRASSSPKREEAARPLAHPYLRQPLLRRCRDRRRRHTEPDRGSCRGRTRP